MHSQFRLCNITVSSHCITLWSNTCNTVLRYQWTLHYPYTIQHCITQDGMPLYHPLQANIQQLYGDEHQALLQGSGERWEPSGWEGRDWLEGKDLVQESLSKPHTSRTALQRCVCMSVGLYISNLRVTVKGYCQSPVLVWKKPGAARWLHEVTSVKRRRSYL